MAEAHKINDGLYVVPLGDGKVQLRTHGRTGKVDSDHYFDRRGYSVDLVLLGYDLLLVREC